MKITFISPFPDSSGGIKVIGLYARKLTERGHDVTIVAAAPEAAPRSTKQRLLGIIGQRQTTPRREISHYILTSGARYIQADRIGAIPEYLVPDADIIVATWWETAEWVAAYGADKGKKFYLIQGYETHFDCPEDRVVDTYRLPFRKITISEFIRKTLSQRHGVNDIALVPNGVDMSHFSVPPRAKNSRLRIGFIFSRAPFKNSKLAIEIVRQVEARGWPVDFTSFSSSRPSGNLRLPRHVAFHFRPDQSIIPGIYAGCDAWLFTTTTEGFGLPILEAMACRTPVLATLAGAAPEIIDGRNGVLLESSTGAFLEQIEALISLPDQSWREMSNAAYRTACAWNWDASVDLLEEAFQTALQELGNRAPHPKFERDTGADSGYGTQD